MQKEIKILVLNEYSFSAATIYDEALSRGYRRKEVTVSAYDFIHSTRYNSMLSLKAGIPPLINLSESDIYGNSVKYHLLEQEELFASSQASFLQRNEEQLAILKRCRFYAPSEQTEFDAEFICNNFDFILLDLDSKLDGSVLSPAAINLFTLDNCPPFFILKIIFDEEMLLESLYFLKKEQQSDHTDNWFEADLDFDLVLTPKHERICVILRKVIARSLWAQTTPEQKQTLLACKDLWMGDSHVELSSCPFDAAFTFKRQDVLIALARTFTLFNTPNSCFDAGNDVFSYPYHLDQETKARTSTDLNLFIPLDYPAREALHKRFSCGVQGTAKFTIALASKYLHFDPFMLFDFRGFLRILEIKKVYPQASLTLVLNANFYSHLNELENETIISQDNIAATYGGEMFLRAHQDKNKGILSDEFVDRLNTILLCQLKALLASSPELNSSLLPLLKQLESREAEEGDQSWRYRLVDKCLICMDLEEFAKNEFDLVVSDQSEIKLATMQNRMALVELPDQDIYQIVNPLADVKFHQTQEILCAEAEECPQYALHFVDGSSQQNLLFFMRDIPLHEQERHYHQMLLECQKKLSAAKPLAKMTLEFVENYSELLAQEGIASRLQGFEHPFFIMLTQQEMAVQQRKNQQYHNCQRLSQSLGLAEPLLNEPKDCHLFPLFHVVMRENTNDIKELFGTKLVLEFLGNRFDQHLVSALQYITAGDDNMPPVADQPGAATDSVQPHSASAANDENSKHAQAGDDKDIAPVPEAQVLTTQEQYSNYTVGNRYNDLWEVMSFFTAALHPEAVSASRVAEIVNPKKDLDKTELSYLFNTQSLDILSFGCSRGDEIFDLMVYFPGQNFTGVDINRNALKQANLTLSSMNLFNSQSKVRFIHCDDFVKEDKKYDIITAMTVLCRHPTASRLDYAGDVYPFEEFDRAVCALDQRLKKGGIICIFNANYSFNDSSCAHKYQQLCPLWPKRVDLSADIDQSVSDYAQQLKQSLPQVNGDAKEWEKMVLLPQDESLIPRLVLNNIRPHVKIFEPSGYPKDVLDGGYMFYKTED